MSIAKSCPYSEDKENCWYEIFSGQPVYSKCPTCSRNKNKKDFDYSRILDYYDADKKVKVGMIGYFADTIQDLKHKVEKELPLRLIEIRGKEHLTRFRNENSFAYELFYPIGDIPMVQEIPMEVEKMNEILYCVEDDRGNVVAKDMNMDNAMTFIRALFDKYFNEEDIAYTIKKQPGIKAVEND